MRLVLGNRHLLQPGGTEVHLVTIGDQLQRLGHEVVLYAPELGPFADHARERGFDVAGAVGELPEACDVVFAQDGIVAYELAERYPEALNVFRICGDVHDFQLPPQVAAVTDLVVVVSDRYARLAAACVPELPLLRLRVPIDIDRLVPAGAIGAKPRRAIVFGNYGERFDAVRAAWEPRGIEVVRAGGEDPVYDLPLAFADADIVVAKSRAALDAMACGRAVYVLDLFGGDGWVTPETYPALEADNFAGQAIDRVVDAAALARDLDGYREEMGSVNRDLVLQHHNARDHVVALLAALAEHVPAQRRPAPLRELGRLVALQSSWEQLAREYRSLYWSLRDHAAQADDASARAAEGARAAERERERVERDAAAAIRVAERERERVERDAAEMVRAVERERGEALEHAAERVRVAEAERDRLAEALDAREDPAAVRSELDALRRTRALRLANGYWRVKDRVRGRNGNGAGPSDSSGSG